MAGYNPRALFPGLSFVTTAIDLSASYNTAIKASSGATITLPDPSLAQRNKQTVVVIDELRSSFGSNKIKVKRFGAEKIQGRTIDYELIKGNSLWLVSDGTDWWLI